MKRYAILLAAALSGLLPGCSQSPVEAPVETLVFPVVLITGTSAKGHLPSVARVIASTGELGLLRVGVYSELTDRTIADPPVVIDSTARILDMKNIIGTHGGAWMMLNPNGLMPVRFSLFPRNEKGIEAARAIILGVRHLGRDVGSTRTSAINAQIRGATTMAEIMEIIEAVK